MHQLVVVAGLRYPKAEMRLIQEPLAIVDGVAGVMWMVADGIAASRRGKTRDKEPMEVGIMSNSVPVVAMMQQL